MSLALLRDAGDDARFGGKAAALARALVAGLPVPRGFALDHLLVQAVASGDPDALRAVAQASRELPGLIAVRSSAVGEDGASSSFAGQHLTRLGVDADEIVGAIRAVRDSAHAPAALAYRTRRGLVGQPRIGVILQELVEADVAAVVFTRNPIDGADVIVIEANYGLGETVVAGAVIPDRFVLDRTGQTLEHTPGDKDVALVVRGHRVVEVDVAPNLRAVPCLDERRLASIRALVDAVDAVWAGPHDLEIAFAADRLHLLQRRPLTHP